MFVLNALLCLGPTAETCIADVWQIRSFATEEACELTLVEQTKLLEPIGLHHFALWCDSVPAQEPAI